METSFGRTARDLRFNHRELEVVIGSLLGDATLLKTTSGYCFRVHHSLKQRSFVDWKYDELKRFVRTPPRQYATACYFRTVTHPYLSVLRRLFYAGTRKIVPISYLQRHLGPVGLATWIMDDGAADGRQMRINTQSFSVFENLALALLLDQKFGLTMTLNYDKRRPRLRCKAASMATLVEVIGGYILPEMRYKLPEID